MEEQKKQELGSHSLTSEFIPYDLASKMKQLGFDEPCFVWADIYTKQNVYMYPTNKNNMNQYSETVSIPTLQSAFKWFREKHGLFSSILPFQDIEYGVKLCYYYCIINLNKYKDEDIMYSEFSLGASNINFSSPEEAELACLEKLIETVENEHANR